MKKFRDTDFLSDDNFILWRLTPTPESDLYWSQFIKDNPHAEEGFRSAIDKLSKLRINKKKLDAKSANELHNRIIHSAMRKRRRKAVLRYGSIAASIAILIGTFFVTGIISPEVQKESIIGQTMPPEDIQLIVGNRTLSLENKVAINLSTEGKAAISGGNEPDITLDLVPEAVNRLVVPFGKTASITLPDGTQAWLNAGSELEFPAKFERNNRTVALSGEMYVEVAPDPKKPFYVRTKDFTVKVTGTKFNVTSFSDDAEQSVVLAEGSVSVESAGGQRDLSPGQMITWENGIPDIREVPVYEYICWKDGIMQFTASSVEDILNRLGRYYNVDFSIGDGSILKNRSCTGKLVLLSDLDEVMTIVCAVSKTSFKREGNMIVITDR